mmetsp:Transcript_91428/g.236972  ORF Transcript_91428/g.236972 Transcript_91428/m.236972 type:complete len:153 (-) Transcript_91428:575-1033(-)
MTWSILVRQIDPLWLRSRTSNISPNSRALGEGTKGLFLNGLPGLVGLPEPRDEATAKGLSTSSTWLLHPELLGSTEIQAASREHGEVIASSTKFDIVNAAGRLRRLRPSCLVGDCFDADLVEAPNAGHDFVARMRVACFSDSGLCCRSKVRT